jgi:uncharacterized protein YqgQ
MAEQENADLKYVLAVADVLLYGPDTMEDNHDRKQLTTTMVDVQTYIDRACQWEEKAKQARATAMEAVKDNMTLYEGLQRLEGRVSQLEQERDKLQNEWNVDQERIGKMAESFSKLAEENQLMEKELREALDEVLFNKCNFESSNRVLREDHKREREDLEAQVLVWKRLYEATAAENLVLEERVKVGAKKLRLTKQLVYTYDGCQHTCEECVPDDADDNEDI